MTKKEIYNFLESRNLWHEVRNHGKVYNMNELSEIAMPYPDAIAKNIFICDDKKQNYYLITVKGNKRVNLKAFRKTYNTRQLHFASEEELFEIMKLTPGSVSPFGILNDSERKVNFYIDKEFLEGTPIIGVHPNDNSATVWMNAQDLIEIISEHGNPVNILENIEGNHRDKESAPISPISEELLHAVSQYIDENFIEFEEVEEFASFEESELGDIVDYLRPAKERSFEEKVVQGGSQDGRMVGAPPKEFESIEQMLNNLDAGFSETLLRLIDRSGKKDSEIYKRAHVDRKLFSKIRNNAEYRPSKSTALAFAFALELSLEETEDFIGRAGFALSHCSKFDVIVEYFLLHEKYDMYELNEVLFAFDQPLIGA